MKSKVKVKVATRSGLKLQTRDGILIRPCHGIAEFESCISVERAVWKSADVDIVPLPIFGVASETGGQVLGAFRGTEMVGFILALAGWRNRKPYLHSHMAAVLDNYRDHGIGRRLKIFQREDALSRGIGLIEWTFDPLVSKNAHFNFMRLGVIARRYLPNAYGITTSPLHGSLPTDRLVAEWHLRSQRVRRVLAGKRATPVFAKQATRISLPSATRTAGKRSPSRSLRVQGELRDEFTKWLSKGYAATAVASTQSGTDYILEPWNAIRDSMSARKS